MQCRCRFRRKALPAGNVSHAEFVKSKLCTENGLRMLDLRHIDSRLPNVVPRVAVREHAILVNFLHISALIRHDRVLLFESASAFPGSSLALHSAFLHNLSANLRDSGDRKHDSGDSLGDSATPLPYEFRQASADLSRAVTI